MDKQVMLDRLYKVCCGCQDYMWNEFEKELDYKALTIDMNNRVKSSIGGNEFSSLQSMGLIPDVRELENITKLAVKEVVPEFKDTLNIAIFGVMTQILLNLSEGINVAHEFNGGLKRIVDDTLLSNHIIAEIIARSIKE